MERLREVLQKVAEQTALSDGDRAYLMRIMPRTAEECSTYSALVTDVLLDALHDSGAELRAILDWLRAMFEVRRFHAMHLYLTVSYLAAGLTLPPLYPAFALDEARLALLMRETLLDFEEYLQEDNHVQQ